MFFVETFWNLITIALYQNLITDEESVYLRGVVASTVFLKGNRCTSDALDFIVVRRIHIPPEHAQERRQSTEFWLKLEKSSANIIMCRKFTFELHIFVTSPFGAALLTKQTQEQVLMITLRLTHFLVVSLCFFFFFFWSS